MRSVKEIVQHWSGYHVSEIDSSDSLRNDLGCDSLDFVEIIIDCEKEYHICIPDDKASKVNTVGDLERVVDSFNTCPEQTLEEFIEEWMNNNSPVDFPKEDFTYVAMKATAEWAKKNNY